MSDIIHIKLGDIGSNDDPQQLQKTVDSLQNRPGHIIIPSGNWPCSGVRLISHLTLEFENNAHLLASSDYESYQNGRTSTCCEDSDRALLLGQNCHNVTIIGAAILIEDPSVSKRPEETENWGGIDGQSHFWVVDENEISRVGVKTVADFRPRMIVFEECSQINLRRFKIVNSPMWTIHFTACSDLILEDLVIDNDLEMPNTDGIDIDGCQNVIINRCFVSGADDSICLKTVKRTGDQKQTACHHVLVEHCTVRSNSCAIKIGTETYADIYDVKFKHCHVEQSNRSLGIFVRDGGSIYEIEFSDISCESTLKPVGYWGRGEAITITSNIRKMNTKPGSIKNISFNHIKGVSYGAINIHGMESYPLEKISFNHVQLIITAPIDGSRDYDLRPGIADYLQIGDEVNGRRNGYVFDQKGRVLGIESYPNQMPGLFAQHVKQLKLNDLTLTYQDNQHDNQNTIQLMPSVSCI